MRPLKITVGLLLLLQAFHPASPQSSTAAPAKTIDKSWLRRLIPNAVGSQTAVSDGEDGGQGNGQDFSGGAPSGQMEDDNQALDKSQTSNYRNTTVVKSPEIQNGTEEQPVTKITDNSSLATTAASETVPSQVNQTEVENQNSSTSIQQNSTSSLPDSSDDTNATTAAPETTTVNVAPPANTTLQQSTAKTDEETNGNKTTESYNSTTESGPGSTAGSTASPSVTEESKTTAPGAPVAATTTAEDQSAGSGDNSERGSTALEEQNHARQQAWAAVLATGVAVAFVGLVAYVIMRKKYPKGFSHRKLVEEIPSDPVLRLDNSEPLDLNFDRSSGYHNPGLQGDDIQMGNLSRRH